MFILRKIVIDTFSNFVNVHDPGQTKAKAKELVQVSKEEAECLVKTTTKNYLPRNKTKITKHLDHHTYQIIKKNLLRKNVNKK